jgi:hypothetical protein
MLYLWILKSIQWYILGDLTLKFHQKGLPRMALVLCTGVDPSVVRTRQLILERAGHVVVPALDEASLIEACQRNKFDVAVVGQTVSPKIKRRIAGLIRESCRSAKLLELYTVSSGRVLDDADSWLEVLADVPQELATRVGALAGQ